MLIEPLVRHRLSNVCRLLAAPNYYWITLVTVNIDTALNRLGLARRVATMAIFFPLEERHN